MRPTTFFRICYLGALLSGTLTSCEEEKPEPYVVTCVDGVLEDEEVAVKEMWFFIKNDNFDVSERGLVIQSDLEYRSYIEESPSRDLAKIDFERKTLLTGRFFSGYSTGFLKQEVISDCEKNVIDYNVTLYRAGDASSGRTYYYALIPKIPKGTKVRFNLTALE